MSVLSSDPNFWFCSTNPDCTSPSWSKAIALAYGNFQDLDLPHPGLLLAAVLTTIATFNVSYICIRRSRPMMLVSACVGLAALFTLFTTIQPALAVDKTSDPDLVAKLKSAATMLDRLDMLTDDQLLYNFSSNPKYSWSPGSVCNANAATWPVLSTVGVTVSQLNLGPCAMLAPHFHRANNLVVAVSGTTSTYMYQENGARLVQQTLTPGMMTIFPQASVHSMYNMGCENNLLYSFLDNSDASTVNVAQAFFMMPQDIGMTVMPFVNLTNGSWAATGQSIPAVGTGSQQGFEACLQKCGLSASGYGAKAPVVRM
ncbi:hypothetical protein LTR96_005702 [Exophiala xenobiotica]|uniref:Cupin type-1 domain-containing protein n=1 Tax=Vermiconidia calcicola TaxID=1690605 RepID=A0AAV9PYG1_9PEZI|nr:hypothetical protein H2202_001700 [Exophiala xenobiotica]KAK5530638.1 hypothetical protein LTR23_010299 [Chaetothyriales sp. CCFEE 6169]KAK5530801.1 hypothetical protein LTR25_008658 [Vermiconidia calcicola]KAK5228342.1 hypothetical protein LTR72_002225 [Exophiala xenobiotica]KAK5238590.1 hypothetical protein LTR47_000333 [Exophiala xenobiotica]